MEPSAAIAIVEIDLRLLVRDLFGDQWKDVLGAAALEELARRHHEEERRRAPMAVPSDLLQYTHFYEIRKVLVSDWSRTAPVLGKKRDFEVLADHIEDFRNAPAHSRELQGYERSLLEGIAGLIRSKVTRHRSQRGPDLNYYPVIESATDSFGNAFSRIDVVSIGNILAADTVLVPGQEVRFRVRATDPQGRELRWEMSVGGIHVRETANGSEAELVWGVEERDVQALMHVQIKVTSSGTYHRHGSYDHQITFRYRVDPPE